MRNQKTSQERCSWWIKSAEVRQELALAAYRAVGGNGEPGSGIGNGVEFAAGGKGEPGSGIGNGVKFAASGNGEPGSGIASGVKFEAGGNGEPGSGIGNGVKFEVGGNGEPGSGIGSGVKFEAGGNGEPGSGIGSGAKPRIPVEVPSVIVPEVPNRSEGTPRKSVVAPRVAVETLKSAARVRVVFICLIRL